MLRFTAGTFNLLLIIDPYFLLIIYSNLHALNQVLLCWIRAFHLKCLNKWCNVILFQNHGWSFRWSIHFLLTLLRLLCSLGNCSIQIWCRNTWLLIDIEFVVNISLVGRIQFQIHRCIYRLFSLGLILSLLAGLFIL